MNDMRLMNKIEYTQMVNTVSESLDCEQFHQEKDFAEKLTTYDVDQVPLLFCQYSKP